MKKNEIKKAIDNLNKKIVEAGHYEVYAQQVMEIKDNAVYGTKFYTEVYDWVPDEEAIEAYRDEIRRLSALYEEKRLKAYLKKWFMKK